MNGLLVWSGSTGWRDVAESSPATPDTIYRIGSTSKAVTSTALARMVAAGSTDLDAQISTYLVPLPNPVWGEITPRQLASHTAGPPDYDENTDWIGFYQSSALNKHFETAHERRVPAADKTLAGYDGVHVASIHRNTPSAPCPSWLPNKLAGRSFEAQNAYGALKGLPIETEVGRLWGRDTLFLNDVHFDYRAKLLVLHSSLVAGHCTDPPQSDRASCTITLRSVYCMRMIELDCWDRPEELQLQFPAEAGIDDIQRMVRDHDSCLWELAPSSWIEGMNIVVCPSPEIRSQWPRISPDFRHFVIITYDHIFEVVARSLEFALNEESE